MTGLAFCAFTVAFVALFGLGRGVVRLLQRRGVEFRDGCAGRMP